MYEVPFYSRLYSTCHSEKPIEESLARNAKAAKYLTGDSEWRRVMLNAVKHLLFASPGFEQERQGRFFVAVLRRNYFGRAALTVPRARC